MLWGVFFIEKLNSALLEPYLSLSINLTIKVDSNLVQLYQRLFF